jgi:hypothetical protein
MVGAEGFEASFPDGHYTVFFVGFNGEKSPHQELARILWRAPLSQFSHQGTTFCDKSVSLVSTLL